MICLECKYSLLHIFEYSDTKEKVGFPTNLKHDTLYLFNSYRPSTVEVSQ